MDCEFCHWPHHLPVCGAQLKMASDVVTCTRPPDHPGEHVACGETHAMRRWAVVPKKEVDVRLRIAIFGVRPG
jgi:hypothetical protein